MDSAKLRDFSDLAADTLDALVGHPDQIETTVSVQGEEIVVNLYAPRAEIAMVVGKQAATAAALHRVLSCIARNWGHVGTVRLGWTPTDG